MDLSAIQLHIAAPLTLSRAVPVSFLDPHGINTVTPDTRRWIRNSTNRLIEFAGDIEITAVTPRLVHQWQTHETSRDISPISINSYLRGLKTFYSRLQKNGTIGQNPAEPVKFLPEPPPFPKRITTTDYHALLQATEGTETAVRYRAILDTFLGTGCRLSELLGMNLKDVERLTTAGRKGYAIYIIGKLGKPRWVYLKDDEAQHFMTWMAERPLKHDPAIFLSTRGSRLRPPTIYSILRRLWQTSGITDTEHTNPHSFRHAFAIRKLNEGYDLPLVSAWLGHASAEFTAKVYVIRSENELRHAFSQPPPNGHHHTHPHATL